MCMKYAYMCALLKIENNSLFAYRATQNNSDILAATLRKGNKENNSI